MPSIEELCGHGNGLQFIKVSVYALFIFTITSLPQCVPSKGPGFLASPLAGS